MKKSILILLAALIGVLLLCGCANQTDPLLGTFHAVTCANGDNSYECMGEYIRLREDGSGILCYNDEIYTLTYTYRAESGEFSFRDENRVRFEGYFNGDSITGTYGDVYEYLYITIGSDEDADIPNTYRAISCLLNGEAATCADDSLVLEADGTGTAILDGEQKDMLWQADNGHFRMYGTGFSMTDGTIANGQISGEVFGAEYVYSCNVPDVEFGQYGATICTDPDDYSSEYYLDGEYLWLYDDGTGAFGFSDKEYEFNYVCEGDAFSFQLDENHFFHGSYADGVIDGTIQWGENSYRYVFEHGVRPLQEDYDSDADYDLSDYTKDLPAGMYSVTVCVDAQDESEDYYTDNEYLLLESDGTGVFCFAGTEYDIWWGCTNGTFYFVDEDDDEFEGTYTDDALIEGVYMNWLRYVFEYDA